MIVLNVASTRNQVISLTTYDVQQMPGGERKVPTKVVESLCHSWVRL